MSDFITYLNGSWIPTDEVKISPLDRGFLAGDVVFEVERTFNGKSFRLKQHIDRLYRSLKYARIDPKLFPHELISITEEAIQRHEHLRPYLGDFRTSQFITRGEGPRAWDAGPPTVCVGVGPIEYSHHAQAFTTGKSAVITRIRSHSSEALDPKVKHYNRMNFNLAELEANDIDPEAWPILRDSDGNLTEGSWGNMFLVTGGVLRTPGDHALLQGVSRRMVFDLAKLLDIPIFEEDLQPYDLYTSDEAFFSSTSYCILPITRVDHRQIGDGQPGTMTKQLLATWSERVGLDIVKQALAFSGQ